MGTDPTSEGLAADLEAALLAMDRGGVRDCLRRSAMAGHLFAEKVVAPALERIGAGWERGELALSQVYMSGRICEDLLGGVLPCDPVPARVHLPMAIAVLDDFHPLGKRIVASVLRANGFALRDYGVIGVEELVRQVERDGVRILLVSTLMLPAALRVRELRRELDRRGLEVRLVVGGAPFRLDPDLYRAVGADATSPTASGAVGLLARMAEDVS